MTGSVITLQQLINAQKDSLSLEEIINGAEWVEVETRLGRKCYTIATINAIIARLLEKEELGEAQIAQSVQNIIEKAAQARVDLDTLVAEFDTEKEALLVQLQHAIDVALAAGAGAVGWIDLLIQTWSGRTQSSKNKDIESAFDYGSIGNGIVNDGLSVENALKSGSMLFVKNTVYDLGGRDILIENSVNIQIQNNVVFKNGFLRIIPKDDKKEIVIRGNLNLGYLASIRLGGGVTPSVMGDGTDPFKPDPSAVKIISDDIIATSQSPLTTTTINITSNKDSRIGNIITACSTDLYDINNEKKTKPVGIYLGNSYDGRFGNIYSQGVFTMGVHVDSTSTRSAFSMCRCIVGNIKTFKNNDVPDQSGQHGFYFHGAYDTELGVVQGDGWGDTISSSADFKFRDNMDCTVNVVDVDRFRITSDANYVWFDNYARNNKFKRVKAKYFATVVSAGQLENNYFLESDIDQCALSSNSGNERGVIFSGRTVIGAVDGIINVSASVFENARVSWKNDVTPDLIGAFFNATESKFYNDVNYRPTTASTTKLNNVQFFKKFNHEPTSAPDVPKAHTSVMNQVDVAADLLIKTFSGNTHSADWRFVNCGVNAPNAGRQPTTKKYRFVSYNDANYPTLNT